MPAGRRRHPAGGAGNNVHSPRESKRRRYWSRAVPTMAWSSICAFGGGIATQELLASLPSRTERRFAGAPGL